jgi:hypothetical protein
MRLASRTGRSYRLVTLFSLIWFLLSLDTPLAKKTKSVHCLYRIYTPTRFILHHISPNSIQITLAFPEQRTENSPSRIKTHYTILVTTSSDEKSDAGDDAWLLGRRADS